MGCSSSGPKRNVQETFSTKIYEDGSKIFSYTQTMIRKRDKDRGKGKHRPDMDIGHKSPPDDDKFVKRLEKDLKLFMAENNFCRDGFLKLDESLGGGRRSIRGECYDRATDEDRARFPNMNTGPKVIEESLD